MPQMASAFVLQRTDFVWSPATAPAPLEPPSPDGSRSSLKVAAWLSFGRMVSSTSENVHAHRARGVDVPVDKAPWLVPDGSADHLFNRVQGRAGAKSASEINTGGGKQAREQLSVRRQSNSIAIGAERVRY